MEKYAKKWPLGTKREAGAGNGGRPVPDGVWCTGARWARPIPLGLWLMRLLLVWTKWVHMVHMGANLLQEHFDL